MQVRASLTYDKVTEIGRGHGMNSEVWTIDEEQFGGRMVVKEIEKANLGPTPSEYFREAEIVFEAEHENVIPIQYACETTTHVCLVMPYFRQGSVAKRIEHGPMLQSAARDTAIGVLSALGHIHSKSYVHFDVKPSNVLFDDAERPMLADFGQTRKMLAHGVASAPAMYPDAIPPEVYTTGRGTLHIDIYHCGLLLYRMVNGDPIWTPQVPATRPERQKETCAGRFPNRKRFLPHVKPWLRTVIRTAIQVDPAKRYDTADEFRRALGNIIFDNDWHVTHSPGKTEWRSVRPAQPDLVVDLVQNGSNFDVAVVTDSGGVRRHRNARQFKASFTSERDAWKHLDQVVFPNL